MVDVLDGVRGLLPAIGAKAEANDRDRKVDEEIIRDLADAGVFGMMAPARFGGREAPLTELFSVVRAISAQCASTGWVVANLSVNTWQTALFSEDAQAAVWGGGPGQVIASSYQPAGQLRPQGDGYLLSGSWRNLSGCEGSDWVFLGALVLDEEGEPIEHGLALVRTEGLRLTPAAECVGLRGAANIDLSLSGVRVPAGHVYVAGRQGVGRRARSARSPLYRKSLAVLYSAALTMPMIGAADGAYSAIIAQLQGASGSNAMGGRAGDLDRVSLEIARAAAEIDQAAARLESTLVEARGSAGAGSPLEMQVRARRDQVLAMELAGSAVDRILKVGGRRALMTDSPIQRAWRDVHVGASHRANDVERGLALFGRMELGYDVGDDLVFI